MESGLFRIIDKDSDEDEYSMELQLGHIGYSFGVEHISLVPIYVGNLDEKYEDIYVNILDKYFRREECVLIVSSDFMHWG